MDIFLQLSDQMLVVYSELYTKKPLGYSVTHVTVGGHHLPYDLRLETPGRKSRPCPDLVTKGLNIIFGGFHIMITV